MTQRKYRHEHFYFSNQCERVQAMIGLAAIKPGEKAVGLGKDGKMAICQKVKRKPSYQSLTCILRGYAVITVPFSCMPQNLLATTLEVAGGPITLAFSPDGRIFFSERITGRVWVIHYTQYQLVYTFPVVPIIGHYETGLIGIALDPDFQENSYIYCYYTYGTNDKDWKNKVVRITETNPQEEVLLDNIPAGIIHDGGIVAFAPDKTLFIGVGVNNHQRELSQDLDFLGGKMLRINRDGSLPSDNPFPHSPVYSYGHRNIFGIAFNPATGKAYVCDVGPNDNDEINIIEKGGNYGWPKEVGSTNNSKTISPIKSYPHVITPTQCFFKSPSEFYFGSFNEGTVHKLTLSEDNFDQVEKDEIVYRGTPFGVVGAFHGPDDTY